MSEAKADSSFLLEEAKRFDRRLAEMRNSAPAPFEWYPYQSLSNINHIIQVLGPDTLDRFSELAGSLPILDVGCGDGDLSFFLEHLGYPVDAIDNPVTNHNGMMGVRCLRQRLGSKVSVYGMDIDRQWNFPQRHYGVILCLGVLYHVKNPYLVLEELSRVGDHMLLSTRITSWVPHIKEEITHAGIAYLLHEKELNNDNSNYWIFSRTCLERLLRRTHWRVKQSWRVRLAKRSDPVSVENDERIFMLLSSCYGRTRAELLHGWHAPENEGWRWTAREFAIRLTAGEPGTEPHKVTLTLYVPEGLATENAPLVLEGCTAGQSLGHESFDKPGEYSYSRLLPPRIGGDGWVVEFRLNRALSPDEGDARERGIIVAGCDLAPV